MKLSQIYQQILNETLFKEARVTDPCECCEYFDFSDIGDRYSGLMHPVYYILEKGETHELKHISPRQYIHNIARGFGNLSYDDAIAHVNQDNVKKYAEAMKRGDKFPVGYYREGDGGQEGRHRALALMNVGCEEMPVVVIKKVSQDTANNFARKYKDYSREELDTVFKQIGYDGISDLDWRTFNTFVKHRLK